MLLRSITKHVKDQNWFAVALDFFIVVFGVFIGVQLGNWNEKLIERKALSAALSNLEQETQLNLDIIDAMNLKIGSALEQVEEARLVLQACQDDVASRQIVSEAVNLLAHDFNPTFVTPAMQTLASRESFISRLAPETRSAFNQYLSQLNEQQDQLNTNFLLAWQDHVIHDPILDGNVSASAYTIDGPPTIIVPSVSEACQSRGFKRRFQLTSGFVQVFSLRLTSLKEEVESFRNVLHDELKAD